MNNHKLLRFGTATVLGASFAMLAACSTIVPQSEQSQASKERITDRAIFSDQKNMQALQDRLSKLNKQGTPLDSYSHAKAQCWLDVAAHEYHRNDRSGFIEYALKQSSEGIATIESRDASSALNNDVAPESTQFCSQAERACQEVAQYHAEHEEKQFGWRHARPYHAIAQDLGRAATARQASCKVQIAAIAPTVIAQPLAQTPQPPQTITKLIIESEALFAFNRFEVKDLSAGGKAKLDSLIARLKDNKGAAAKVNIVGFTDAIGSPSYNQTLSEKRAATVREYLVGNKANAASITASGAGMTASSADSTCTSAKAADRVACLAADRRVEIEVQF